MVVGDVADQRYARCTLKTMEFTDGALRVPFVQPNESASRARVRSLRRKHLDIAHCHTYILEEPFDVTGCRVIYMKASYEQIGRAHV